MTPFSTAYLGSIAYYAKLLNTEDAIFDYGEHFIKQTHRNRCYIESPSGFTILSIPVEKPPGKPTTNQIKVSYQQNWQKDHWRSIESAYGSSPFFQYYDYILKPLFNQQITSLVALNESFHQAILTCLKSTKNIKSSTTYIEHLNQDHRNTFNLKNPTLLEVNIPHYLQVFHGERKQFVPNLSILDLLFNEGPTALEVLKKVRFSA